MDKRHLYLQVLSINSSLTCFVSNILKAILGVLQRADLPLMDLWTIKWVNGWCDVDILKCRWLSAWMDGWIGESAVRRICIWMSDWVDGLIEWFKVDQIATFIGKYAIYIFAVTEVHGVTKTYDIYLGGLFKSILIFVSGINGWKFLCPLNYINILVSSKGQKTLFKPEICISITIGLSNP